MFFNIIEFISCFEVPDDAGTFFLLLFVVVGKEFCIFAVGNICYHSDHNVHRRDGSFCVPPFRAKKKILPSPP